MSFSSGNTSPHQLHTLLSRVRGSESYYEQGWSQVLGAEWGTVEFAKRHSEVVNLLLSTIEQLDALPERSRDRSLRYAPSWWTAVVQPQINWTDPARPAMNLITQEMLDHLEAAADLVAGSLVGSTAAPRSTELQDIAEQCREWIGLLGDMEEAELAGPIKDRLVAQIEHLVWLIENVEIFGGARVADEASRVMGSLMQATATVNPSPANASRWQKAWNTFLAVCLAFSLGAPALQQSIEAGSGLVKEISGVVHDIRDME